jgi:hypothetical protein
MLTDSFMDEPHGDRRGTYLIAFVLATLVGLPLLYVGSYFALVRRDSSSVISFAMPDGSMGYLVVPAPKYAIGGELAETVFGPLHFLDRKLRPGRWDVAAE